MNKRKQRKQRRRGLNGTLRRMKRQGFDSVAISEILGDKLALRELDEAIVDLGDSVGVSVAGMVGTSGLFGGDGSAGPFLTWLWEHREEIMRFIMEIIGMFG